MAQPYVGEIRMFAGNFPPVGWMFCDGNQMAISENETLFQLIGTTYGGDGESTFNLPNLQSRIPIHMGTSTTGTTYQIAEMAGVESVTLTISQIPSHTHPLVATNDSGSQANAGNGVLAAQSPVSIYRPNATPPNVAMNANSVTVTGGSQPHENMQPFLCVNFIISLFGIFPSPT
jgi:microcystin-dependent protein